MNRKRVVRRQAQSRSWVWLAAASLAGALAWPAAAGAQGFGPPPTFATATSLPGRDGPQSIAVVDVNEDTVLDLVVANFFDDSVSVFLGNGAGGFATAVNFTVGDGPVDVAVADVNRDDNVDFVTANGNSNNVSVRLGDGLGGFTNAPLSPFAAGTTCQGIAIGEVTGNSFVDLVVVNTGSDSVSVLAGTGVGSGLFAAHVSYGVGTEPIEVALAHLNGDGRLDVIVTNLNASGPGSVSILMGNASGTLNAAVSVATGGNAARSVAVGALDGDANVDLVVANRFGLNVGVLLGNGDGTFEPAVTYTVAEQPLGIALADLNGDGHLDVAVTRLNGNAVTVLNGNGTGALQPGGTSFATGLNPVGVGPGDFNGDGKVDLAIADIASDTVSLLLNTLVREADLSVTKTDGATTAAPGALVTYTITVSNAGPGTLTQINLVDTLPASLQGPVFTPTTGAYNSGTGAWTGITLTSGGSVSMTVAGTISTAATGSLVNSVAVAVVAPDTETNTANNTASDTDTLVPRAELTVTKTDSQTSATPGSAVTYTITVSSTGPSTLTQINLVDTLPAALQSPVFTPGTGSYNSGTGAWTGISLASGGSVSMTVGGTISATATGSLVNSVAVAVVSPDTESNTTDNTASDTDTLVRRAELTVTKTDGQTNATPGTAVTYTITVSSAGPSTLSQINLVDTLPAALQSPVFTPGTGSYNSGTGGWTGITLASGGSVSMTVGGTISAAASGNLVNSVAVAVVSPNTESNTANNTASDTDTLVRSADLTVTNTDGQASVAPGALVTYTITVSNAGPSTLSQLRLTDTLPAALQSPVFTPGTGAYNSGTGVWTGITLASGGSVTMTLSGTVSLTATGTLVNGVTVATIAPDTDPSAGNNSASDTDTLVASADVAISKIGPPTATAGQNVIYTISVTNNGPSNSAGVSVADVTPTGLTFVSNSGDCVSAFPCSLGTLGPGATRTITATFAVPAGYTGPSPIQNTATVSSSSTDPDLTDNTATASSSFGGLAFHTLSPCRVLDTRDPANAPALTPGPARTFAIVGVCSVPGTAQAVSINVTVTSPTDPGDLRIYPAGTTPPLASAVNYGIGQTRANNAVVKLGATGGLEVLTDQAAGTVHFILDVNGYFE